MKKLFEIDLTQRQDETYDNDVLDVKSRSSISKSWNPKRDIFAIASIDNGKMSSFC